MNWEVLSLPFLLVMIVMTLFGVGKIRAIKYIIRIFCYKICHSIIIIKFHFHNFDCAQNIFINFKSRFSTYFKITTGFNFKF